MLVFGLIAAQFCVGNKAITFKGYLTWLAATVQENIELVKVLKNNFIFLCHITMATQLINFNETKSYFLFQ
jgi:hypothetical protein